MQYFKYPQTPHWRHDMQWLGEDEHGVWLGAAAGSLVQKGDEAPRAMRHPFVQLVHPRKWWTALFNSGHRRIDTYVDVITQPIWEAADRVEMVDLDLDVIRLHDGRVYVDDEDEFEEHRVTLGYPPRMVDTARAVAARLAIDMETRRPPFDGAAEEWLEMVL